MRAYIVRFLLALFVLAVIAIGVNISGRKLVDKKYSRRNVVVARINDGLENYIRNTDNTIINEEAMIEEVFYSRKGEWDKLYGADYSPKTVTAFLFFQGKMSGGDMSFNNGGQNTIVCGICPDGNYMGIAVYEFADTGYRSFLFLMNITLILAALTVIVYGLYIYAEVIVPFNRLSDYPERLSKGGTVEKLPETKNRFFGRYVWGMNMLADKLENDRNTIRRISDDHQKLVTVLVHGIKTPAANIKLFSEAISTGLYDPEGKVNEKDAELAGKIEKNADEIERIVSEAVDTANAAIFEFNPDVNPFYSKEIEDFIREEYTNSLKVNRIPFTVETEGNPLIKSDLNGVCRIIRQLMDNAIKYGDGTGITLRMSKTDEGILISIVNKGKPLPSSELPYVFNSLWRGSNSTVVKGSGIGLYEARFIARKLGGDIWMRAGDNETEVTLLLSAL